MIKDLVFGSSDGLYTVTIRRSVIKDMLAQCSHSNRYETGGILIGNYNDDLDNAFVCQISHEPIDSQKSNFSFIRGIQGLHELIVSLWVSKKYYVGEWHFHPYAAPTPSSHDLKAIKAISNDDKYQCRVPIMIIIGGNPHGEYKLRVLVQPMSKRVVDLMPVIL